jgi:hypothetical protein
MEKGLRVLDISDPKRVHEVGAVSLAGEATGVAVSGPYAYVAIQTGIQVVDISRPEQPRAMFIASTTIGRYWKITISGSYAYVTNWLDGLLVYDLKFPASPVQVGAVKIPALPWDVAVSGNLAFVAAGANESKMYVVDVSNPIQPVVLTSMGTQFYSRGIAATEGKVYMAGQGKFGIVNVTDPISPRLISVVDLGPNVPNFGMDLLFSGSAVYVADWDGGLTVVDTATEPPLVASWHTVVGGLGKLVGKTMYSSGAGVLRILDITDPIAPKVINSFTLSGGSADDILIRNGFIYVLGHDEEQRTGALQVIDGSDPFNLLNLMSLTLDGSLKKIVADETKAYVLGNSKSAMVYVLDLSDPGRPQYVNSIHLPVQTAQGLRLADSTLYVIGNDRRLLAIPTSGLSQVDIPYYQFKDSIFDIEILDHHVYVAGREGISVVDFPESGPPKRATIVPEDSRAIAIFGNKAYVLTYAGLMVLDLAAPTSLSQRFSLPGLYGGSIVTSQEYVFVSTKEGGVVIFKRE